MSAASATVRAQLASGVAIPVVVEGRVAAVVELLAARSWPRDDAELERLAHGARVLGAQLARGAFA